MALLTWSSRARARRAEGSFFASVNLMPLRLWVFLSTPFFLEAPHDRRHQLPCSRSATAVMAVFLTTQRRESMGRTGGRRPFGEAAAPAPCGGGEWTGRGHVPVHVHASGGVAVGCRARRVDGACPRSRLVHVAGGGAGRPVLYFARRGKASEPAVARLVTRGSWARSA